MQKSGVLTRKGDKKKVQELNAKKNGNLPEIPLASARKTPSKKKKKKTENTWLKKG